MKQTKLLMTLKNSLISVLVILPAITFADTSSATASNAVKPAYQVITDVTSMPKEAVEANKVKVLEFFSYGCPWCYKLDPFLQKWLKTKAKNVEFQRVPVTFEPQWQIYNQIFYTAKALKVEGNLHSQIFEVIQNPLLGMQTPEAAKNFFVAHGVSPEAFDKAFNDNIQMKQDFDASLALMKAFKIMQIPTVIIDGKYMISNASVGADGQKFVDTLDMLVQKQQALLPKAKTK